MNNIFVIIKQVPDTETKIKINADKTGIDEAGIKWIMNPYDEYAVEEALQLKKANPDAKVTVFSLGPKKRVVDTLRTALAMGADEAVVVDCETSPDAFTTAQALSEAMKQVGECSVVFAGKLSIDGNTSCVPQYVAEFLNIPHATVVNSFQHENGTLTVERESDGGTLEKMTLNGPAVIAANKGLNTPRYASLPGIMKAKKKPLKELSLGDLGLNTPETKVSYSNFELPPEKPAAQILSGELSEQVKTLVDKLRNEAKVI